MHDIMFSLGAFLGVWGKSGGHAGQVKSSRHAPVESAKEPVDGEIGSDEWLVLESKENKNVVREEQSNFDGDDEPVVCKV